MRLIFLKNQLLNYIYQIYIKERNLDINHLISNVVTGGIFGLGSDGYILAIISLEKMLKNEN